MNLREYHAMKKASPNGTAGWPDPSTVTVNHNHTAYTTPDGVFPSVTRVLKVLGLGTNNLVAWSARVEREACLEAARECFNHESTTKQFMAQLEEAIGPAKAHQKQM